MKKTILALAVAALGMAAFAGPRITILGDSYSTFEGYIPDSFETWYRASAPYLNDVTKVEETWWWQVIQGLGGQLERNNSYSGSTICYAGYKRGNPTHTDFSDRAFVTRAQHRMGEPDIILVFGGTNDSWADSPIGTNVWSNWTSADLWTFRGALPRLYDILQKKYSDARIFFILNSELKPAINDAVHEISAQYSIPCIDLHDIDKQNGHPSVAGMKEIAAQVIEFIKVYPVHLRTPPDTDNDDKD